LKPSDIKHHKATSTKKDMSTHASLARSLEYCQAVRAYEQQKGTIENTEYPYDFLCEVDFSVRDPSLRTQHKVTIVELACTSTLRLYRWSFENTRRAPIKLLVIETVQCGGCAHFISAIAKRLTVKCGEAFETSEQTFPSQYCPACNSYEPVEVRHYGLWYRLFSIQLKLEREESGFPYNDDTKALILALSPNRSEELWNRGPVKVRREVLNPAFNEYITYARRCLKRALEEQLVVDPKYLFLKNTSQETVQEAERASQVLRTEFR